MSLSADGNTAIVGGGSDNNFAGGAWIWTRSGGVWTQQGTKLVGSGAVGNAWQGGSVSLPADGNTAIVGGSDDNSGVGAAWVFASAPPAVWTSGGPYGGIIGALAIDPTTPATLYAGTYGGGVFKSTNSGGNWAAAMTGLSNLPVGALAINPTTPSTLYAGVRYGGVFKSTDSGGSWAAVNTGLTNLTVVALAINPTPPAMLYA